MGVNASEHISKLQRVLRSGNAAATSEIAASWRRCIEVHGIDPAHHNPVAVVERAKLVQSQQAMEQILSETEPELDRLFRLVRGAGYLVLVSDPNGITVAERSEQSLLPEADSPILGTLWAEESEGTNGIGTCLSLKRPTLVRQSDHLRLTNTNMICAAAPLFDPSGGVAGAIDITTFKSDVSASYLPLALSVVAEAARRIEARLFRQAFAKSCILSLSESETLNNSVPLVALDSNYLVVGATRAVRKQRGLTDEMLKRGIPLSQLLPSLEEARPDLANAERMAIQQALALHSNNVSAAAAYLGISRATLYRKLPEHRASHRRNSP